MSIGEVGRGVTAAAGDDGLVATRDALARHDWATALVEARRAEVATRELEAERLDLLAEAAWWSGHLDDCIEARERAYLLYEELGLTRQAGQCAVWLWEHHAIGARPAIAGAWLRRARRSLDGDRDCIAYGTLLLREAEVAHGGGDLESAIALDAEVTELARRLRCPDLEAEALQATGRVLIDRGELDEGMAHLDEAMLFGVEGRLGPYSTGKVYCSLISACEDVGDLDRAAEWTEATLRWAERHPFAIFPGICRVHRAIVLGRRGDLAAAEAEAARACEELRHSHVANSAAAWSEVGDIRRRLGDLDGAEEAFTRAQALCGQPCGALALLRLAQGRVDAAMVIISGCLRESGGSPLARSRLLPMQAHVAIAAGDLDAAAAAVAELEDIASAFPTPVLAATSASARGRLQLARRDPAAVATLQTASAAWARLDVPYEVATARTLLGQALLAEGDATGASDAFAAATRLFDQVGARLDAQQVPGARPAGPEPAPAGLTDRELEVLRLVAAGLTNGDIAVALHLSVKTVSRHLSNIFTKIGVSSRSAATAFAFENDLVEPRSAR